MKFDVVTIGSATRDAFFKTDFKIVDYPDTPLLKAYLVPLGEKVGVKDAYFTLGGNAANASVTFVREGYRTAVFTKIGSDMAGEEIKRKLKQEGVETKFMSSLSTLPTAYSTLLLQNGERTILSYHGAIDEFSLGGADWERLKARWWYVSLPGESYKLLGELLHAAKRLNVSVALNPSFKHLINGRKELTKHLKNISFLSMNEGEAAIFTGIPFKNEAEVFQKLDALTPGIVAVTSGAKGATVSDGRFIYKAGAFNEKKLVDRTGAGDAYGSGFVAGLMRKNETCKVKGVCDPFNIEYAIRLASANATSVVEHLGATEGALTRREFDASPRFKSLKIFKKETAV